MVLRGARFLTCAGQVRQVGSESLNGASGTTGNCALDWLRGRIFKAVIMPSQFGSGVVGRCPEMGGDLVGPRLREPLNEGVYNSHTSVSLPMTQVFGIDRVRSERFGSRQNSRVPIGDRESLGLLDRNPH